MTLTPVNHCAEAARLRELHAAAVSGEGVQFARFGEDEVRYYAANIDKLERLIAYHEGLCMRRRSRFAIRGRYSRPY